MLGHVLALTPVCLARGPSAGGEPGEPEAGPKPIQLCKGGQGAFEDENIRSPNFCDLGARKK